MVLGDPGGGLLGVRAGIDRLGAQIDAAGEQPRRRTIFAREVAGIDARCNAGNQHPLGLVIAQQRQPAVDPAGAAGRHDDAVGGRSLQRPRQQQHERGEPQAPGDRQHAEQPRDHSVFRKAAMTVRRAATIAIATNSNGSSTSHSQSPDPSDTPPSSSEPSPASRLPTSTMMP